MSAIASHMTFINIYRLFNVPLAFKKVYYNFIIRSDETFSAEFVK